MATGDDTIAAGMDVVLGTVPANTIDTEITKTRDYIAQRTSAVVPVAKGGTGDSTASGARSNLAVPETAVSGLKFTSPSFGRISYEAPGVAFPTGIPLPIEVESAAGAASAALSAANNAQNTANAANTGANNAYARADEKLPLAGGSISGHIFLPAASAATNGFTVAYINSDGRISKGTSSLRYKDLLEDPDVNTLGNIWPTLRQYAMKGGDGKPTLGYIAEEVADEPDTNRYAVYQAAPNDDGEWLPTDVVDSIDFIQLLIAQVAQLNARLSALESTTP